jgi:hypothetical protein
MHREKNRASQLFASRTARRAVRLSKVWRKWVMQE